MEPRHAATPASLVRWLALLLACAVVGAGVAYAVATQLQAVRVARADILFVLDLDGAAAERFLSTQAVIAESQAVLGPVGSERGLDVGRLEKGFDVSFPKGAAVMRLEYHDTDPAQATAVLSALTDRYLLMLRQMQGVGASGHQLIVPPYLVEDAAWPRPLQAAALGAVIGLAVAATALLLFSQRPRPA
ncbi:MAG: hypothetical protein U1E14_16035 [Geminicoccaceae bacterium]